MYCIPYTIGIKCRASLCKSSICACFENRYLAEMKNRISQPSELQVKLTSIKRNVWTGVQSDDKGPLSWGISSFAMNSYFTDSEALLR